MTAALASGACVGNLHAQSAGALIDKLVQKGILTEKEAKELLSETTQTNNPPSGSKWRIDKAIKSIGLYGNLRMRYEYRGAENAPGSGAFGNAFYRERFRYAARVGIRGELLDNWYYGLRVETSTNPRSTWVTFGKVGGTANSPGTPFDKASNGVNVGLAYLGWMPSDWSDITFGRMPMPLYVTPMLWDSDLTPEGAAERFKWSLPPVDLFANLGQFIYQDTDLDNQLPSGDTFMLAWQVGATVKLAKDISLKAAPVLYVYTGKGAAPSLLQRYTGEGVGGLNPASSVPSNQSGLNDLTVLEVPAELNFKLGKYGTRLFGDFAYNFDGDARAQAAFDATHTTGSPNPLPHVFKGQDKAYQLGAGFGNLGLVYGTTSKKNTWEVRAYWQHVEQYAADVNLLDSDFFEGRANLQGFYSAFAYSFTDNIISTFRYGLASRINESLGTGGKNPDMPELNPIRNYHILQLDLTWRF